MIVMIERQIGPPSPCTHPLAVCCYNLGLAASKVTQWPGEGSGTENLVQLKQLIEPIIWPREEGNKQWYSCMHGCGACMHSLHEQSGDEGCSHAAARLCVHAHDQQSWCTNAAHRAVWPRDEGCRHAVVAQTLVVSACMVGVRVCTQPLTQLIEQFP
jgi:hypothetical protein